MRGGGAATQNQKAKGKSEKPEVQKSSAKNKEMGYWIAEMWLLAFRSLRLRVSAAEQSSTSSSVNPRIVYNEFSGSTRIFAREGNSSPTNLHVESA